MDLLRAIQGLGGAAVVPAAVSTLSEVLSIGSHSQCVSHRRMQLGILAHTFPPSRARSIAFSTFAAGAPLGGAFGYVFGGILVQLTE